MSDNIIQLNEDLIKHDLKDLVRSSVEETLNALLDKEADELVNAQKYERSSGRQGYRSGHYERNFQTTAGEVELNVPKLKGVPFETAIIERYRRRESTVEEALIEMYLAGVSVRRVEDITEALWGTKVSPGTISNLNKKAYEHIEQWRSRPLSGDLIPFMGEAKEMFLAQKKKQDKIRRELGKRYRCEGEFADLVFVTSMGSPVLRYHAEKECKKVVKAINEAEAFDSVREQRKPNIFEDVYPHALRHTFCSRCFEKGMNPKVVQALMGHQHYSTTIEIYTHVTEQKFDDEIAKFGNAIN